MCRGYEQTVTTHENLVMFKPTKYNIIDACETFRQASLHISSLQQAQSLPLLKKTVDELFPSFSTLLLSILFSNLARLVLLNILRWNSRSSRQIVTRVADFRHVAPLCVTKWMNAELIAVLRRRCWWSILKLMQIGSGVVKTWAIRRSLVVSVFW